jgi:hypothetical protein
MMQSELLTNLNVAAIGQEITHELGAQMVKDYQKAHATDVRSYVIGKNILTEMLAQPGCEGIEFYNAINEQGQKTLVYVGLNAERKPILTYTVVTNTGVLETSPAIVADRVLPRSANDFDDQDWFWFC